MPTDDVSEFPLRTVLARLRKAAKKEEVAVRDLIEAAGSASFSTLLLAIALLVVTPLSAIPTVPSLSAIVITLLLGQWVIGRRHVWLPGWIMRRSVASQKFSDALDWIERPASFIDRHTRIRLTFLVDAPMRLIAWAVIFAVVATWPFLELLPLFTSVTSAGIACVALGFVARDGLWIAAGYSYLGGLGALLLWLV